MMRMTAGAQAGVMMATTAPAHTITMTESLLAGCISHSVTGIHLMCFCLHVLLTASQTHPLIVFLSAVSLILCIVQARLFVYTLSSMWQCVHSHVCTRTMHSTAHVQRLPQNKSEHSERPLFEKKRKAMTEGRSRDCAGRLTRTPTVLDLADAAIAKMIALQAEPLHVESDGHITCTMVCCAWLLYPDLRACS